MAKKIETTESNGVALATTQQNTAIARPSFIPENDLTGTEDIGLNDVRLPRLAIAQQMSYQMNPDDARFIEGLKPYDMFNDLTGEIYGRGPFKFIPIKRMVTRIEWEPGNQGVPRDINVPANDPRLLWTKDPVSGESVPPLATTYHDFVIYLLRENTAPEKIVLSIKATNKFQTLAATRLTTFIKVQEGPIYCAYKTIATKGEKFEVGTAGVFIINNGARLDAPGQTDEEWNASGKLYAMAKSFYEALQGKRIIVEREPGEDDFPTDDAPSNRPAM